MAKSRQEVFNRSWDYHVTQGNGPGYVKPEGKNEGYCSYAQGCFIGNQLSAEFLKTIDDDGADGLALDELYERFPHELEEVFGREELTVEPGDGAFNDGYPAFLLDGQIAHDYAAEDSVWSDEESTFVSAPDDMTFRDRVEINYRNLARKYDLEVPVAN